ncbi:MAG: hypothetical protein ABR616_03480 [Dermatophilaceae bacterium]
MATTTDPFVTLGWSAISWIEHYLVHGPGDVQGQAVELDDEFARFILKAYRLDPTTGNRHVRRAFLSRAKGRSKSGLAAFVSCFEALGPARYDHWAEPGEVSDWGYEYEAGEPVGRPLIYVEVLCVATEEGQAGNTYDGIHYMLNRETCSNEMRDDYPGLDVGLSRVILPNSRGSIEPLSSGDTSKDGGKSTFIVADETHLWILPRLKSMHATMSRNLLKRKVASGWMLETSTMYGQDEGSVAEGTHAYAKSAKAGTRAAESLLFDHQQASDRWDIVDRKERIEALQESYGPAAEWMDVEALADAWDDPQVTEAEYRRYWLNQPVPMSDSGGGALSLSVWRSLSDPNAPRGEFVAFGADVAEDRSAWIAVAWTREDGDMQVMLANDGQPMPPTELPAECARMTSEWGGVIVAPKALHDDVTNAGAATHPLPVGGFTAGCGTVADLVKAGTIHHGNQPALNAAVKAAKWRSAGTSGERAFQLKDFPEVGPLAAVVRAVCGLSAAVTEAPAIY